MRTRPQFSFLWNFLYNGDITTELHSILTKRVAREIFSVFVNIMRTRKSSIPYVKIVKKVPPVISKLLQNSTEMKIRVQSVTFLLNRQNNENNSFYFFLLTNDNLAKERHVHSVILVNLLFKQLKYHHNYLSYYVKVTLVSTTLGIISDHKILSMRISSKKPQITTD